MGFLSVLGRLRWGPSEPPSLTAPLTDRAVLARSFAYLYIAGATLVIASLLFLSTTDAFVLGLLGPPALAYVVAFGLLVGFRRIPLFVFRVLPALGAVLVAAVALSAGGSAAAAYSTLHFWVVLMVFYFFETRFAGPTLLLVVGLDAAIYQLEGHGESATLAWLMMTGVLVISGVLMGLLRQRTEQLLKALLRDLTRRRRAEENLSRSEAMLEHAQRMSRVGSWEWDVRTNVVALSAELYRIYGISPDEFAGSYESFLERVHAGDRLRVHGAVREAFKLRKPFEFHYRIVRPSGEERILLAQGEIVAGEDGEPAKLLGTGQDVTEQKLAEEALTKEQERVKLILETAHEAFISMDAEGRVTDWNPEAEAIFGWRRSEVLGRRISETIVPERHRAAHRAGLARFLEMGMGPVAGRRIEIEALHRDGHEFTVELTVSPLRVGETWSFNAFLRDISQRRRAQAYFAAQHAVTEVLAQSSRIEEAIPRLLETLGRSMGWKAGGFWMVDGEANRLTCRATWRARSLPKRPAVAPSEGMTFAQGDGLPGRVWVSRRPIWIDDVLADPNFALTPEALADGLHGAIGIPLLGEGEFLGVIEFMSDAVKAPDDEMTTMMAAIGSQVGQFVHRKRAEEEADQLKREFFAAVSHELRTPLTSIIGYTDLLLSGAAGEPNDQQRQFLEITERNAKRQMRLVGDLLFVSQVEANTFTIEPGEVQLREIVADSIEAARPAAAAREITLESNAGDTPLMLGDRDRLAQLVDNLLSNAIKFTPEGGRVALGLGCEGEQLVLEVWNSGSYISPADRERLFDRFFRSHEASEQAIPGVGLGLTITRAIVVAHGGTVSVRSEVGEGTTFRVEFPVGEPAVEALKPVAAVGPARA